MNRPKGTSARSKMPHSTGAVSQPYLETKGRAASCSLEERAGEEGPVIGMDAVEERRRRHRIGRLVLANHFA